MVMTWALLAINPSTRPIMTIKWWLVWPRCKMPQCVYRIAGALCGERESTVPAWQRLRVQLSAWFVHTAAAMTSDWWSCCWRGVNFTSYGWMVVLYSDPSCCNLLSVLATMTNRHHAQRSGGARTPSCDSYIWDDMSLYFTSILYTVLQKTLTFLFYCSFYKCWPISIICGTQYTEVNLQHNNYWHVCCTCVLLLHCLGKY